MVEVLFYACWRARRRPWKKMFEKNENEKIKE